MFEKSCSFDFHVYRFRTDSDNFFDQCVGLELKSVRLEIVSRSEIGAGALKTGRGETNIAHASVDREYTEFL